MFDKILEFANGIQKRQFQRMILGGLGGLIILTLVFWRVMVPLLMTAGLVAGYLRYSRPKDSL